MYKHQKSVPKLSFIFHSGTDFLYYSFTNQNIPDFALMHYSYDAHNSE